MDAVHFHLIFTHFPIVGTLIGIFIFGYGLYAKNESIQKVALVLFIAMAALTIPVYLSGEQAEETVEHLPGVNEHIIENHEELAEKAIWLMGFLGFLALISLIAISKRLAFARKLGIITFIMSLITFGVFASLGNLGGQIRHTEIRNSNIKNGEGDFNLFDKKTEKEEHEEHEDDDD